MACLAFLTGGETVVHLTGKGMGGRNQELALAAAGGYSDGETKAVLKKQGIDIYQVLRQNDAYHALEKSGGLIMTGATGTNVNGVAVLLIRR